MSRRVVHKDPRDPCGDHLCKTIAGLTGQGVEEACCEPSWKKVTCKKCLALRK